MKVGISGPILVAPFKEFLFESQYTHRVLNLGLGGTAVNHLALALLRRGHQVVLFSLDPSISSEIILSGPKVKICIAPLRTRVRHRALDFFKAEREHLCRAILRESPDVVHAHWTYEYALGALDSRLPSIVTARDAPWAILKLMPNAYRFIRLMMAYKVAGTTRYLTANSPYTADHWRHFMLRTQPIPVIPNGCPEDLFSPCSQKSIDKTSIVYAAILSGWGKTKNARTALEAFFQVRKVMPQARMILFGNGHGKDEAAYAFARHMNWEKGVEFAGETPYPTLMERLCCEVDVLIHPALEESFGNPLIEAMARGIPVIAGLHSGAVPYVLEQGKAGLLVDVRSPFALATSMLRLAKDAATRHAIGQAGFESAKRRFHIDNVVESWENYYLQAIGS